MSKLKQPVVKNRPVARFFYQGKHSHPVRRTVLVTSSDGQHIHGYELREGATTRNLLKSPIKTYRRDRIAKISQCRKEVRDKLPKTQYNSTTLNRFDLMNLVTDGA